MNDTPRPDTPQAWIRRAESDLALGTVALATEGVLREDACFHAQQSAEKALKALLLHREVSFPRTHVIETLLDLLQASGSDVPDDVNEAYFLTQYAVQTRYPGEWEPVTDEEAHEALYTASRVLSWVVERLKDVDSTELENFEEQ
jgi:HEPN domain-containing protein